MSIKQQGLSDGSRRRFVAGIASGAAATMLASGSRAQAPDDGIYDVIELLGSRVLIICVFNKLQCLVRSETKSLSQQIDDACSFIRYDYAIASGNQCKQ